MTDDWTADVTNDPRYGYDLCIEISQQSQHRMTIRRAPSGQLFIEMYPVSNMTEVPAEWLMGILSRAERELPPSEAGSKQ